MGYNTLSAPLWHMMLTNGAHNLRNNAKIVNDLNVFPIPDGDTGENMSLTIEGGIKAIKESEETLGQMMSDMSMGMLLNARGNSGVILSQFFGGLAKILETGNDASLPEIKKAFENGVTRAYASVMTPTEGTILTVIREATEVSSKTVPDDATLEDYFKCFNKQAHKTLKKTPDLLPVLKEAGVIDSGGAGLIYITEGMEKALHGETVSLSETVSQPKAALNETSHMQFGEDSELSFGYCTECLLQLQNRKTDIAAFDIKEMISVLETMGESIVCVQSGSVVKLHIHTFAPGEVFNYCQRFGEFLTVKVENMNLQHTETTIQNNYEDDTEEEEPVAAVHESERKKIAIVAVANGQGICDTFLGMGVDFIVHGGQTMNPSAESFIEAFDSLNADNIIVLPNNSNIVLTARQAADMYEKASVWVLESKTIGDGYAALSMFDPDAGDMDTIMADLTEAMKGVSTGLVSHSVRDSHLNGLSIREGDYIGILDKDVVSDAEDVVLASEHLLDEMDLNHRSVLILISGKEADSDQTGEVINYINHAYPDVEVYPIEGGQDVYPFIFISEE
ncbi:MAG: DAK2 domain-containing protein [Clostridia bacterium]|nr:DAK2 domain-containing protein [Clostridia bacterium]